MIVVCILLNQLLQGNIPIHGNPSHWQWLGFFQAISIHERTPYYPIRNGITNNRQYCTCIPINRNRE